MNIKEKKTYKNYNLYIYKKEIEDYILIGVWIYDEYYLIRIDNILSLTLKNIQIICINDIDIKYLNIFDFNLIKELYPVLFEEFFYNENE